MDNERIFYTRQPPYVQNSKEESNAFNANRKNEVSFRNSHHPSQKSRNNSYRKSFAIDGRNNVRKKFLFSNMKNHCGCGCENSKGINIIGVKQILDKKSSIWIRLLWFIVVSICIVITICQIVNCIQEYLKHPVVENIKIIHENEIKIPSITICPSVLQIELFSNYEFNYQNLMGNLNFCNSITDVTETKRIKDNTTYDEDKLKISKMCSRIQAAFPLLNKSMVEIIESSLNDLQEKDITITWRVVELIITKFHVKVSCKLEGSEQM